MLYPSTGLFPASTLYPGGTSEAPVTLPPLTPRVRGIRPEPSAKYLGNENVPRDIKRLRRSVYDTFRRFGQPILVKRMYTAEDVESGLAQRSPNMADAYGQTRAVDPLSWGTGFCSVQTAPGEWIAPDGTIVKAAVKPSSAHVPAPLYRGFDRGYLTYFIEPDAAEDFFKLAPTGALIKVQTATAQAPWWPDMNDNDMIVNVELDRSGNIVATHERYQAKQVNPVSIRGQDRRGRREYSGDVGNRWTVGQSFEMTLVPTTSPFQHVDTDR